MKTIICTTGTSIARGCQTLRAYQESASGWEDAATDLEQEIAARLAAFDLGTAPDRVEASAELHSLHRLQVEPGDTVVLLATDTVDGRVCAEALARSIRQAFALDENGVRLHRVPGLQVRDGKRLREEGLVRFADIVISYVENPQYRHGGELILNPTGGFKGVVPFLAAIGMIFRIPTVYVFEHANNLITLPPLPVQFDLHLYERAAAALRYIHEESYVHEEEFFSRIDGYQTHERDLFLSFVEQVENQMVTLSPLAFVLLRMSEEGARQIFLSSKAAATLKQSSGLSQLALERLLIRLGDPVWRSIHIHSTNGSTDLEVYKPGNTAERAFCIIEGDRVNVCELFTDHDLYERMLSKCRRADYQTGQFTAWEPDTAPDRVERNYRHSLAGEVRRLQTELNEVRGRQGAAVGGATQEWKQRLESKTNIIARQRKDLERARKTQQELEKRIAQQERQIAALQQASRPGA
jgi:putative CRISPR-associated protein (TIGR02619 family)